MNTERPQDGQAAVAYAPPVDALLTYGDYREADFVPASERVAELGLGSAHVPDLVRLATDPALQGADEDALEVWAPAHALSALSVLADADPLPALIPL